ncbi:MAG: hypothetical protein KDK39_16055 [Leptospiraceae bacterium]|nr:hypothetical protein [Leptospiraceae bacterium]
MQTYLHTVQMHAEEQERAALPSVRVEMKGAGPSIVVIRKARLLVTNERLIVAQKVLFSKKYQIRYMLWFDPAKTEQLHFLSGAIETGIRRDQIQPLELPEKVITEIRPGGSFDWLRLFVLPEQLRL